MHFLLLRKMQPKIPPMFYVPKVHQNGLQSKVCLVAILRIVMLTRKNMHVYHMTHDNYSKQCSFFLICYPATMCVKEKRVSYISN
jgi:hypothetical protein